MDIVHEPILITKRGKQVAQLTPVKPESPADWRGAMSEGARIAGDIVAPATDLEEWEVLRE